MVAEFRLFQFTPKKAEIVSFGEKGGILHLSYLLQKSGDPKFFLCVYHEIQPREVWGNFYF